MVPSDCQVHARSDAALVLVVRVDGRIVSVAAGHPCELDSKLDADALNGAFLNVVWPDKAAQTVQQRVRDATRRRSVSNLEIAIENDQGRRTHDVTVLPHGRDRALVVCRDSTRRASLEREVRDIAFRDPVTDLPNRAAFLRHLEHVLNEARLVGRNVSVLRINLRRLDYVNRTFGRQIGTRIITALARRAERVLDDAAQNRVLPGPVTAFLARTEGNEYAVVLAGDASNDALRQLGSQFIESLTQPESIGPNDTVRLEICIGAARFPQDADDIDTLLANAGVALYDARKHSASAMEFFTGTSKVRSLSRLDLATELRWALENDQFSVVYQPWLDVHSNRTLGAEAALRWDHPLRGQVPMAEILPVAQMNDLCDALGDWVLARAAADVAALDPHATVPVAINLLARQSFSPHLVERASRIIARFGAQPQNFCFEIRAADFLRDIRTAEGTARALRDAGFCVILDECGFEALHPRALLRTGIRQIKLARRLVQRLPEANAMRVVASHLGLAQPLGIELCATGVEDAAELDALKDAGCRLVQGPLVAKPVAGLEALARHEVAA